MGRKKQDSIISETTEHDNGVLTNLPEDPIQTSGYAQVITPEPLKSNTTKAIALEKFMIQVPMPGQKNGAYCVIKIKEGQEIVDPYVIKFLQQTSKPVKYL